MNIGNHLISVSLKSGDGQALGQRIKHAGSPPHKTTNLKHGKKAAEESYIQIQTVGKGVDMDVL